MGKKYKNLYHNVYKRQNLWDSYKKASKNKKSTLPYLNFKTDEANTIVILIKELKNETYRVGKYHNFIIFEPKKRIISALPFRDRIVQHSLYNVINPIFEKTFLPNSFACRVGKGTHAGVIKTQSLMRKEQNKWYLKIDFKGYFYNIDRETLWKQIESKISCKYTLSLIEKFHPRKGVGIPIGNLTSQLLANVYGTILDQYLQHEIKKDWVRYMDDCVIFFESKEEAINVLKILQIFIKEKMKLSFSKWYIKDINKGVNFLGYKIFTTHRLIRKNSIIRAKRKLKNYDKDGDKYNRFLSSWKGHIKWANSYNLQKKLDII